MKSRSFLLTSLLFAGLAAALTAQKDSGSRKHPELRLDNTPLRTGEAKAPAQSSYADVLDQVRASVVSVYSSKIERRSIPNYLRGILGDVPDRERRVDGLGSGVIISPDGYILTNNHVVADADELKVLLSDERELVAKVIGADPKTDIAVIKIDGENLPAATLTDSDKLRVGDIVFAIGNPLGVGQTVTMGIVSALARTQVGVSDYQFFIQTDAAINPGNSGGALVDADGRLVGINTAIYSRSGGSVGIGFAIPAAMVKVILKSLVETGTVARGMMGISSDTLTPDLAQSYGLKRDTKGVIITELNPSNGPAAKAGLKPDDIITSIDGRPVATFEDLRLLIAQTPPGTKVKVEYFRDAKPQTAEVVLAKLEDGASPAGEFLPGVSVATLTPELRREYGIDERVNGLVITEVAARSAYGSIFPRGGVITQINGIPVRTVAEAREALRDNNVPNRASIWINGANRRVSFLSP
jgi:serine protease Do/serine protease DegQ